MPTRRRLLKLLAPLSAGVLLPGASSVSAQSGTVAQWPTDSWSVADPASVGVNGDVLSQVPGRIAAEAPLLSGMVVAKDGLIVGEWYQNGFGPGDPLNIWSVTKSVTNIGVMMALEEELIAGLDQTIGELVPDIIPAGSDQRVWNITIEQLLTMTAGWAWDSTVNFSRAFDSDDLGFVLSRPMNCDPGGCYEYDSGCSNLLSYIVQRQSGELLVDYLQPRLFDPLGIAPPEWLVTTWGANRGAGALFLSPRDMAKIGLLYATGGDWDGQELVDVRWVYRSTQPQSSGVSYATGVNIGTGPYGYHWWVADKSGYSGFAGLGYGGQVIYAVPGLNLIVTTGYAGADPSRPDLQQPVWPTIEQVVLPAVIS